MFKTNNILDGRLYNIALDLYMTLNCHRLCKILGDEFDPNWYYDGRDHEFILFQLDPDIAKIIRNDIDINLANCDDNSIGLKAFVNPICLAYKDCEKCYRNAVCPSNVNHIITAVNRECLDVNHILTSSWYRKALFAAQLSLDIDDVKIKIDQLPQDARSLVGQNLYNDITNLYATTSRYRLYNIALDLYMTLNCHRLCKILGDEFNPNWYYDGRDHQYIVLELNPDEAKSIWNNIRSHINNLETDFVGLQVHVNPICLAANKDCHECYRNNVCQRGTDKIAALCEKKCLDIDYVLSQAWYAKAFETTQHFIEK